MEAGEKRKGHSKIGSLMARKTGEHRNYIYIKTSIENVKKTRSGTNDYYITSKIYMKKNTGNLKMANLLFSLMETIETLS